MARTHGTISCAMRGGPDGGPCPCALCLDIKKETNRKRSRERRNRERLEAGATLECLYCPMKFVNEAGRRTHQAVCDYDW